MKGAKSRHSSGWMFLSAMAVTLSLGQAAGATSITVELSTGYAYALDVRWIEPAPGATPHPHVAFSGLGYVLRQFAPQCQWDWDARTRLLRLAIGDQRFSFSSARARVAVNDRLIQVALPIRFIEGEIWMPVETCRLITRSIEGLHMMEPEEQTRPSTVITTTPIVGSPEDALREGLLGDPLGPGPVDPGTTESLLAIPPPDVGATWRVVFDPVLIDATGAMAGNPASIRASLVQIADRCAALLNQEGSLQPHLLTEHDEATSPDRILERLANEPADLIVLLRFEISPLRQEPGYLVLYTEESVDSLGLERRSETATAGTGAVPRPQRYVPFQDGNRRLAEAIGTALEGAALPEFRDRQVVPAPLYILKRCPARAAMLVLSYPGQSPALERLADSGFRETVARALAGALIDLSRGHRGAYRQASATETVIP